MDYKIDRANNLYIIRIDTFNDEIFKEVIKNIIEIRGIKNKLYCYNTYFTKDYTYCIVDFNRKKYCDEEIEFIAKKYVKK